MSQFLCIMVPKDVDQAILDRLGKAFEYAMSTPDLAEFISGFDFLLTGQFRNNGKPLNF